MRRRDRQRNVVYKIAGFVLSCILEVSMLIVVW
jgi:hypothetical protein